MMVMLTIQPAQTQSFTTNVQRLCCCCCCCCYCCCCCCWLLLLLMLLLLFFLITKYHSTKKRSTISNYLDLPQSYFYTTCTHANRSRQILSDSMKFTGFCFISQIQHLISKRLKLTIGMQEATTIVE